MKTSEKIRIRRRAEKRTGKFSRYGIAAFRFTAGLLLLTVVILITTSAISYAVISQKLPSIEGFDQFFANPIPPTTVYDRSGQHPLLVLQSPEAETAALTVNDPKTEHFSEDFLRLVVASREPDFWEHSGSAGWSHLLDPQPVTIAEELTEIVFAGRLGSGAGKAIRMRVLAREITDIYGRNQILTWYLNHAYFGQHAFGTEAAARTYLNKSASQLTAAESVLLCAILRSPALNPIDSQGAIRESYLAELTHLTQKGALSAEEADALQSASFIIYEPLPLDYRIPANPILQKAVGAAYEALGQENVERGGFSIQSTIDYELQQTMACLVMAEEEAGNCGLPEDSGISKSALSDLRNALSASSVSAVLMDVSTGQLLAAIDTTSESAAGSTAKNTFTPHEPGSSLTPFVVLAALNRGYSPSSLVWDLQEIGASVPTGFTSPDQQQHGPVRLRTALTGDYLRPISEYLQEFGAGAVWNQAEKFGLTFSGTKNSADLIFSGGAVTAEALAGAYSVFAHQGTLTRTGMNNSQRNISILSIHDKEDRTYNLQPVSETALLDKGLAYLITHMLGEEKQSFAYLDRPAAVKIGRVFEKDDIWVVGYTPQISAAVWIGGDEQSAEIVATSFWRALMEAAHKAKPVAGWDIPENISHRIVCAPSGLIPGGACPQTVSEVFLRGSEPTTYDDLYISVPINRDNQLLATVYTPPEQIRSKTFMNLPENAKRWAAENKIELIPTEYDPVSPGALENPNLEIISPEPFSSYTTGQAGNELIEIWIDLHLSEPVRHYQIAYGNGPYPENWTSGLEGEELPSGRLKIGTIDPAAFEPGLYDIRVSVVTESGKYYRSDTLISLQ